MESASANLTPSLLGADLVASSDASHAVTAQRRVNNLMSQASGLVGKVSGLKALFQDYSTSFIDRSNGVPSHWIASQTLELRSTNSEALLSLVVQLQEQGMTIGNLGWQVPLDEIDAANRKACLDALAKLRQEASDAAGALDMVVAGYQDIDLTGGSNPPTPFFARPGPVMMAARAARRLRRPTPRSPLRRRLQTFFSGLLKPLSRRDTSLRMALLGGWRIGRFCDRTPDSRHTADVCRVESKQPAKLRSSALLPSYSRCGASHATTFCVRL